MSSPPKRGRPPSASLEQRILEGMSSKSQFKCDQCHRVFPRAKSLRAHYNCHTGLTPYACDYPGCDRKFRQSGHLRSHTFIHTGERPFRCPRDNCDRRYIHSSRRCEICDPAKKVKLIRDGNETVCVIEERLSEEQLQWIKRYQIKKNNRRGKKRPAGNYCYKENIPVNNKRKTPYKNDGYNSAGLESPSSSPIHKSEQNPAGLESPSSSPIYINVQNPASLGSPSSSPIYKNESFVMSSNYCDLDESGLEAALILVKMQIRYFQRGYCSDAFLGE